MDKMSIPTIQTLLSNTFNTIVSEDCIKKANDLIKISSLEHYNSFNKLTPFLEEFSRLNPGFKFLIKKSDQDSNFEKVAILFSYSRQAINHCYKVVGVDSAFLGAIHIVGDQKNELSHFIEGIPMNLKIMFKRCHITGLSGRTLNNEMIVFAISIGYGETIENYNFLFKFLRDNEVFNIQYRLLLLLLLLLLLFYY